MLSLKRSISTASIVIVAASLSVPTASSAQSSDGSQWDPASLEDFLSSNVVLSTVVTSGEPLQVRATLTNPDLRGELAFSLVSMDGMNSVFVWGSVQQDQRLILQVVRMDAATAAIPQGDVAAMRSAWRGFWSDYWYYLTHPSAMDDDLEIGFYVAGGTAVVAGGAAGGLAIVGINPVIAGGGVAAGGGAAAGGTAGLIGSTAVVAPGLGAGTYPALVVNGTVYVARFHSVAWQMAGHGTETFYGLATINAAGQVINLVR